MQWDFLYARKEHLGLQCVMRRCVQGVRDGDDGSSASGTQKKAKISLFEAPVGRLSSPSPFVGRVTIGSRAAKPLKVLNGRCG